MKTNTWPLDALFRIQDVPEKGVDAAEMTISHEPKPGENAILNTE